MNELALFAGAGGGILGGILSGWRTVCAVEIEPYAASVLMQRQNDGILPPFPIWDDVCTFDGKPWRGIVDVVSGGFPCQDISSAGKGKGITGERSGLWKEFARIIGEVRPRFAFVENSPVLTSRGIDVVLGDLATMGYNARWGVVSAENAGASHQRERIWIVAYAKGQRRIKIKIQKRISSENSYQKKDRNNWEPPINGSIYGRYGFQPPPGICRVDDGMAENVDRLKAIGNGQVPAVARLAWEILSEGLI